MYQNNPTEMFRERQLGLLREAEDRHLARHLKRARFEDSSERRAAGFGRAIALWGRTSVPYFRA